MLPLLLSLLIVLSAAAGPAAGDTLELENAWVRVWRSVRAPHEQTATAEHLPRVVVYLTDAHERLTDARGKTNEVRLKAGAVAWQKAGAYSEQNVSDRRVEAIVIDLKPVRYSSA